MGGGTPELLVDVSICVLGHPAVPGKSSLGTLCSLSPEFLPPALPLPLAPLNVSPHRSHPASQRFIPRELMIQTSEEPLQTPWAPLSETRANSGWHHFGFFSNANM